ncbi:diguanylate cyclase [Paenibacillus sp. P96]|uniref:Diguanylate cyclase n=1 Tax=Paenibacillus zeirhizosphaerae TaxID=2987519 RepID=A0ABT9FNR6_9BACL|nr:diguanylate cyclase [Paenibacillus sp. P96]MDP4096042.1 diguanylate cyclase [Paenibacillus sp. P96]
MRLFKSLHQHVTPTGIYAVVMCLAGAGVFAYTNQWSFLQYSSSEWVTVYSLLGAVLILEYFTFQLPPASNKQSMDSSVYLACIFVHGSEIAIFILFLTSLIAAIRDYKLSWWKHLINFSIYALAIFAASTVFQLAGGPQGPLDDRYIAGYVLAMLSYFAVNTVTLGLYFYLAYEGSLKQLRRAFVAESLLVYLCTLILSLVLTVLIYHNGILGLVLFLGLSMLLSHAFKQLFDMFRDVEEKSIMDRRTGLYNHSYFENVLESELSAARKDKLPLSLALIDIDDFKKYNDQFGHLKGDQLLGFLGNLLKKETEGTPITASRYGGEEFTLLMPGYTAEQAYNVVNRIRKKLNDSRYEGVEIFPHGCLSFSGGISEYQAGIYDKSQLVDQADKALYYAKHQGKNTIHLFGSFNATEREIDLAQDVRDIEQQLSLFLYKDISTFKHSKRVFKYAMDISEVLGLGQEEKRRFVLGALIHDIGKLEIPWDILNKREKLTPEEWTLVQGHVTWGRRIVEANERFEELIPFIELHHERYDGTGYPYGFAGEEIPRLCRMLTVIDSFDAMTTERPYQQAKTFEQALEELRACSGSQFDPELTRIFIRYIKSTHPVFPHIRSLH